MAPGRGTQLGPPRADGHAEHRRQPSPVSGVAGGPDARLALRALGHWQAGALRHLVGPLDAREPRTSATRQGRGVATAPRSAARSIQALTEAVAALVAGADGSLVALPRPLLSQPTSDSPS